MAQGFGSDINYDLSSASVLALGVVGRNYPETHDFNHQVRDQITQLVQGPGESQNEEYVTTIIHSIGNTDDPYYTDQTTPYLDSEFPLVRASAGQVLAKICGEECATDLATRMSSEKEVIAREATASGFAERGIQHQDKSLIEALSSQLMRETQPSVQIHIIDSLGPLAKDSLEIKTTLVRKFHQEKDAGIKVAIGKYVSARDILWLVQ